MGFLKDFMTRFRVPEGTNWGWYQNAEVDKLGAEVMQTFDTSSRRRFCSACMRSP